MRDLITIIILVAIFFWLVGSDVVPPKVIQNTAVKIESGWKEVMK